MHINRILEEKLAEKVDWKVEIGTPKNSPAGTSLRDQYHLTKPLTLLPLGKNQTNHGILHRKNI
ncbi:hypothetical protein ADIS_4824 [Lunatimonas lonarensis]|uniref:Uncharacterized protein n=1 Tax=Lunatimonas lonarensis TaxID=1232681 RepID=R7ZKU2_9BACT|nr:hypothetical protein ADIS_4824 [Lunatimonas lonarensis]